MKSLGSISEAALFMPLIETLKGENAPINHAVRSWFGKFVDISAVVEGNLSSTPAILLRDPIWSKIILNAFKAADINVERFVLKELSSENETEEVPPISGEKAGAPVSLFTEHKRYNENHKEVGRILFSLDNEESAGSRQFFRMISHFFIVLHNGLLITVDELDAKLHPQLCEMLLNLFNSPTTNPNNAQLIFATHNPLLMDRKLLRRDQIWFVEKNSFGESDLYCLTDFKKVRNDASYAKNYLMGRYGALPYLGDFENLMPEAEK
ncbi:ATP-binding protein [Myxococcota bacterium]|nr:ATP-binding protein [Myxococcota bacterium]